MPVSTNGGNLSYVHSGMTTGHTGPVPGGSTGLSWVRNKKSRETERVEVVVTQGLLDRWVSGYALQESARQMRGIAPAQAPGTKISICHGVGDMICRQQHDHHVE